MGRVDLFHSRRVNFSECKYWIRDERTSIGDASKWILQNKPSGTFFARPVSVKSNQMNVINGVWATDNDRVTIESDDHIDEIARGCVVEYANELWLVDSVQKQLHLKESQFAKHQDYKYVIALSRG